MQYRVVAPMLACSGDYTPIYALIATNKEGVAASMGVEPQPALNIAAGKIIWCVCLLCVFVCICVSGLVSVCVFVCVFIVNCVCICGWVCTVYV